VTGTTANSEREPTIDRARLRQQVNALLEAGRVDEAMAALRRLIDGFPDDGEAHRIHGAILADRGQAAAAVPYLDRAVHLTPRDVAAALACGKARLQASDPLGAAAMFHRATALAPAQFESHFQLGVAAHKHGGHDLALTAQTLACQLQPSHAGAQFCRARAFFLLGRDGEADAAFALTMALDQKLSRERDILKRTLRPSDVRRAPVPR
jgi:tetratricopeptide (TPR) repeat protein